MKCLMCGSISVSVSDYKAHNDVHKREHIPAKGFYWWLGTYLDAYILNIEQIDGLDNFELLDTTLYLSPNLLNAYYELYKVYVRGTCRNSPCWECIKKNSIRTMPERRYMRWKLEKDGMYEPDKRRLTPKSYNIGDYPT